MASRRFALVRYSNSQLGVLTTAKLKRAQRDLDQKCHVLCYGEKDYIQDTKRQIESKTYVSVEPLRSADVNPPSSPPLCRIVRTVRVTESGNTKYSLSPDEEPFQPSEDEYVPPEMSTDSSGDETSPTFKTKQLVKLHHVTKKLFPTDQATTSSSVVKQEQFYSDSNMVDNNQQTDVGDVLPDVAEDVLPDVAEDVLPDVADVLPDVADVLITDNGVVVINVFRTLHADSYRLDFSRTFDHGLNKEVLKATIVKQAPSAHTCCPVDYRESIGYVIRDGDESKGTLTLSVCCQEGVASGKENKINELGVRTAFLTFATDDIMDDLDVTPVKGCKTTRLKQHFCIFCKKLKTCLRRHFLHVHATEERVVQIREASKLDSYKLVRALRLEGDNIYNKTVPLSDRISVRRPLVQMTSKSVTCSECGGLFGRKFFYKHSQRCTGKKPHRRSYFDNKEFAVVCENDDAIFAKVLADMREGDVKEVIKNDPLLRMLGVYLVKSQSRVHNMNNARQELRRAARLLIELRRIDVEIFDVWDFLVPEKYKTVTTAMLNICSNNINKEMDAPNLALIYGPLLSHIIERARVHLIRDNLPASDGRHLALKNFELLHKSEFKIDVTRRALMTVKEKRYKKVSELPTPEDVKLLMDHMCRTARQCYDKLRSKGYSFDAWSLLTKCVMCQILVFNRRRGGELSRVRLSDYLRKSQISEDIYKDLSRLEIVLAKEFSVVKILAKRGRVLNLLIKNEQVQHLDLIIAMRNQAGINNTNDYLFAYCNKTGYLNVFPVLKQFAIQCGAKKPETLTSTFLRKQVATMSQLFNLNDNEIQQLADFMGHDRRIHQMHYRLSEVNTQVTRLSRFLAVVGDQNVYTHKGKTLDEIPVVDDYRSDDEHDETEPTEKDSSFDNSNYDYEPMLTSNEDPALNLPSTSGVIPQKSTSGRSGDTKKSVYVRLSPTKKNSRCVGRLKRVSTPLKKSTKQLEALLASNPSKRKKYPWKTPEKKLVLQHFNQYFNEKRLPSLKECQTLLKENRNVFQRGRNNQSIYTYVRNCLAKEGLR